MGSGLIINSQGGQRLRIDLEGSVKICTIQECKYLLNFGSIRSCFRAQSVMLFNNFDKPEVALLAINKIEILKLYLMKKNDKQVDHN